MHTLAWVGTLWATLGTGLVAANDSVDQVAVRVDELVEANWKGARVEPAGLADDAEFLRRLYLDVGGRVPTSEEARAFLLSKEPDKRVALVEELLASPDFAEAWARRLSLLLLGRGRPPRQVDAAGFESYLRESLAKGKAYDQLVRELLTGSGSPVTSPEVNFLLRFERKPEDTAEFVSASFLGVSIGCARCHDHPYEPWTQEDFYGMASAFGGLDFERPSRSDRRVRREFRKKLQEFQKQREEGMSRSEAREKRQEMAASFDALRETIRLTDVPGKKLEIDGVERTFPPRFLDGTVPQGNPREALADWMLDPKNPYVSRNTVNRVWEAFFGRGLVDPVDAFGASNPPSHPELLDFLAADFSKNGFDLKRLITIVATTETYQRSSRYTATLPDPALFAVARPRRMSPDQLFESLVTAAELDGKARFEDNREQFLRRFTFLFDTDAVDDVEIAQGSIPQSLALLNSRMTNRPFPLSLGADPVEELFLRTLSRFPTAEERGEALALLDSSGNRAQVQTDVLWAIVNSSEFLMVH